MKMLKGMVISLAIYLALSLGLTGSAWSKTGENSLSLQNLTLLTSEESGELISSAIKGEVIDKVDLFNMIIFNFSDDMIAKVLVNMEDFSLRNEIFADIAKKDRVRTARVLKIIIDENRQIASIFLEQLDDTNSAYILNLLEEFDSESYALVTQSVDELRANPISEKSKELARSFFLQ